MSLEQVREVLVQLEGSVQSVEKMEKWQAEREGKKGFGAGASEVLKIKADEENSQQSSLLNDVNIHTRCVMSLLGSNSASSFPSHL